MRTFKLMPIECRTKSNLYYRNAFVTSSKKLFQIIRIGNICSDNWCFNSFCKLVDFPHAAKQQARWLDTICAPCSLQAIAVFHAIDFSSSAPKMIPFFPAKRLFDIELILVGAKINVYRFCNGNKFPIIVTGKTIT